MMNMKWRDIPVFDPSQAFTVKIADTPVRFDGPAYDPALDDERLTKQLGRVWAAMQCEDWFTLRELARQTGDPEASISAQLRHLRKPRFGGYTIDKRRRGGETQGLFEYRCRGRAVEDACEVCNGSGGIAGAGPCPECAGTGHTHEPRLF